MLDEKGLMVPAIIPDTKIELVVMSDIFVEKNFKVTLMVNYNGSSETSSMGGQVSNTWCKSAEI